MATSFQGWLNSWNGWGATDPNAMRGSAAFSFTASLQVADGQMQGTAAIAFSAQATLSAVEAFATAAPTYYSASLDSIQALRRQQLEEDEVILALIQKFVTEA